MKSFKTAFLFTLAAFLFALAVVPVFADYGETPTCTNQYGNTVECPPNRIVVNKKVRQANDGSVFVENITSTDPAYSPNAEIEYDVAVTNTSNVNFPIVTVIDILPSQVTFVSGPGTYEAAANKLTYEISNLNAGQTVHNRILVKAKDSSVFPNDITCEIINKVTATGPGGQSDEDTASLCVQTNVLGATTLPVAGFEEYTMILPFIAMAVIGFGILAKEKVRRLP